MKVLVTGGNGFVGSKLIHELALNGHEVIVTGREAKSATSVFPYYQVDLCDAAQVATLVAAVRPEALVHLAGMAHVGQSQQDVANVWDANVGATTHLLKALTDQQVDCSFLLASTGLVFSPVTGPDFQGYSEASPLGPVNRYGWSKLAAEAAVQIFQSQSLRTYIARPFNHIGPGQSLGFVAPALAQRVIEATPGGTVKVGNLLAERDFCDVRDIVRAYRLIIERQPKANLFVLGSGHPRPIRDLLDHFLHLAQKNLTIEVDPTLLRQEHDRVFANPRLAAEVLGWQPQWTFEETLTEVFKEISERRAL